MTLQEARRASGLSIRKAAKAIGVAVTTVNAWENHGSMPRPEILEKAADVYGVPYVELKRSPKPIAVAG